MSQEEKKDPTEQVATNEPPAANESTQTSEPAASQSEQKAMSEAAATSNEAKTGQKSTSTGLEQNVAGLLCYVLGFITGIVFLLIEKDNRFVRFHAWQSTIIFAALFLINLILGRFPVIGTLISLLITPVTLIIWIVMMVHAYQGKKTKFPIIGDFAENQVNASK